MKRRRAEIARAPAVHREWIPWAGGPLPVRINRWTFPVLLLLGTIEVVFLVCGAILGQLELSDLRLFAGIAGLFVASFWYLRGPVPLLFTEDGIQWDQRSIPWSDMHDFFVDPRRPGQTLTLITRFMRLAIPVPLDRVATVANALERFRPRFGDRQPNVAPARADRAGATTIA